MTKRRWSIVIRIIAIVIFAALATQAVWLTACFFVLGLFLGAVVGMLEADE